MSSDPGPTLNMHRDVLDDLTNFLPAAAAEWVFKLRDDAQAAHRQLIDFETQREARAHLTKAEQRLDRLLAHRSTGGFELAPDDNRVVSQTAEVNRLRAALGRMTATNDTWTTVWQVRGQVVTMVETWLRDRPSGTTLEVIETPVKLGKGEGVLDAISRERRLASEIAAKRDAIARRPYPLADCKRRAREILDEAGARGAIDVAPLVRHFRDFVFPTQRVKVDIIGADRPTVGLAHEVHDGTALAAWVFKDALIKKLDVAIDACDTTGALSHEARQKAKADLTAELLAVERRLAALIWKGKEEGLPVEFDPKMSQLAILQCELRTVPKPVPGTSPEHVIERVGGH